MECGIVKLLCPFDVCNVTCCMKTYAVFVSQWILSHWMISRLKQCLNQVRELSNWLKHSAKPRNHCRSWGHL